MKLFTQAVRSGKDAVMAVTFANGIRAEIRVTRDGIER